VTQSLLEADFPLIDRVRIDQVDAPPAAKVAPHINRRARCVCANYLRELGVHDPEVLSRLSSQLVRKAQEQAADFGSAAFESRLMLETLDVTDSYVQKWISGVEKQLDLRGGVSRCGEIAMRMPALLAEHPQAIESIEMAIAIFQRERTRLMPAQPPNTPAKFVGQPLIGSNAGFFVELFSTIAQAIRVWLPVYRRRHA
jgi:hypothetical protein